MRHSCDKSCDIEKAMNGEGPKSKTAGEALKALQGIRGRVKPAEESPVAVVEETTEVVYKGVRVREDVERALVQLFFPHMPAGKVRRYLKKHGFAWSPGEGCWQCERTVKAGYHARAAVDRGELKERQGLSIGTT